MKQVHDNILEKKVKHILDDYQPEFKEEYWMAMQEKLNATNIPEGGNQFFLRIITKYAAALIIILGLGLTFTLLLDEKPNITAQTSSIEKTHISFADGSNTWINNSTTLSYPKLFSPHKRSVKLNGEAYFEIAKDSLRPYFVNTECAEIKVLGTKFNVEASNKNSYEKISVLEGKVKITALATGNYVILTKGQSAIIYKKDTSLLKIPGIDINVLAWHTDTLRFINEPLSEVSQTLSKHYNTTISINNETIQQLKLTSSFSALSLKEALEVIAFTLDVNIDYSNNTIQIKE